MKRTLLVEIGCEEIPARMLPEAAAELERGLIQILDKAGLGHGAPRRFWTPRRLAVLVPETDSATAAKEDLLIGPPAAAAWDNTGAPGKALIGFAKKQGLEPSAFFRHETDKGVYAAARVARGGESIGAVLAAALPAAVASIPFPKMMRWAEGEHRFVRPVHWIVTLSGEELLPLAIFGVEAGRETAGHRTLGPGKQVVPSADQWEAVLEKAGVIVDPARRRIALATALAAEAEKAGGLLLPDPELLEQIADIVEYPGAVTGSFPARFVEELPWEVLKVCLRHHQLAFCIRGGDQKLLPHFAVAVNRPDDPEGHVRRGHEWAVVARLEDALFFWNEDRKAPLADRGPALDGVVFQKDLGTYAAKTGRVAELVAALGQRLGRPADSIPALGRAAELARCDLVTGLVGEFPELQGVAGGLLAFADGEPEAVAAAVYDLYRPAGGDDSLPASPEGKLLGLADRLDTLAGGFLAGLEPSGSKDPFALRRAGNALIRLAVADPLVDLRSALDLALARFPAAGTGPGPDLGSRAGESRSKLIDFLFERFAVLAEREGARYDEIAAVRAGVTAGGPFRPADLLARLAALRGFRESSDFLALVLASKRVGNILSQAEGRGERPEPGEGAAALALPAELELARAVGDAENTIARQREAGAYQAALATIAGLRPVVDRFFDDVLVMDPDAAVRRARLGLLARVRQLAGAVVEISEIVVLGSERTGN